MFEVLNMLKSLKKVKFTVNIVIYSAAKLVFSLIRFGAQLKITFTTLQTKRTL